MRVAAVVVLALCGCQDSRFVRRLVGQPVEANAGADVAAAARVEQVGRQILSANIFCGVDAAFQTLGNRDAVLFHRGQQSVFISDSLVNRCGTDDELAAVLCHELGKMVAERRNATRMGYADPTIDITFTNSGEAAGLAAEQSRLSRADEIEKRTPKAETTDPNRIGKDLLKAAGFDESHYAKAEQLLKGSNKNRELVQQLDGGTTKVEWSN